MILFAWPPLNINKEKWGEEIVNYFLNMALIII